MKGSLRKLLATGCGIGVVLLILSYAWPSIFPSASQWKEADQKKLAEASTNLHSLSGKLSRARLAKDVNSDRLEAELRHWKREHDERYSKLQSIKNHGNLIANIFYYTGIVMCVASCGALVYLRDEHAKRE